MFFKVSAAVVLLSCAAAAEDAGVIPVLDDGPCEASANYFQRAQVQELTGAELENVAKCAESIPHQACRDATVGLLKTTPRVWPEAVYQACCPASTEQLPCSLSEPIPDEQAARYMVARLLDAQLSSVPKFKNALPKAHGAAMTFGAVLTRGTFGQAPAVRACPVQVLDVNFKDAKGTVGAAVMAPDGKVAWVHVSASPTSEELRQVMQTLQKRAADGSQCGPGKSRALLIMVRGKAGVSDQTLRTVTRYLTANGVQSVLIERSP
jgi:hypothetical protein